MGECTLWLAVVQDEVLAVLNERCLEKRVFCILVSNNTSPLLHVGEGMPPRPPVLADLADVKEELSLLTELIDERCRVRRNFCLRAWVGRSSV